MSSVKTVFAKIVDGELPADKVFENDFVLAFRDMHPQAPVHVLVIPKKSVRDVLETEELLLGKVLEGCKLVAKQEGLEENGFRIVINTGSHGGQTVFHLHAHVLGGRHLGWPPG